MVLPGCVPEQPSRARGELGVGVGVAMARGHVLEEDELGCHLKGAWKIIAKDWGRVGGGTIAERSQCTDVAKHP